MSSGTNPAFLLTLLLASGLALMFWRQLLAVLGLALVMVFAVGLYEAVLVVQRW